jgi:Tfp pilus assembly protein PilO
MNAARIWTLGAVVAIVGILAAGFGLGVEPQLASASAADATTMQAQSQNVTTQGELARLSRLAATQSALEATNAKLGSAITGSLRLNTFSQQLRDVAVLDGVTLISLVPSTGKPYAAAPAAVAAAAAPSSSVKAAPAAVPGEFGKSDPLITAANFTIIPVTITVAGTEAAAIQFASDVQHLRRLVAVDTVAYTAGTTDGQSPTTTISGDIYALRN